MLKYQDPPSVEIIWKFLRELEFWRASTEGAQVLHIGLLLAEVMNWSLIFVANNT